jgi:hypothetical protein
MVLIIRHVYTHSNILICALYLYNVSYLKVLMIGLNGPYNDFRNSNRTIHLVPINHKLPNGAYNSVCLHALKCTHLCIIHSQCCLSQPTSRLHGNWNFAILFEIYLGHQTFFQDPNGLSVYCSRKHNGFYTPRGDSRRMFWCLAQTIVLPDAARSLVEIFKKCGLPGGS